jgi:protein required for attachment to host cells
MSTMWIVMADVTEARIYESHGGAPVRLVESILHPEGRLTARELAADPPGRTLTGAPGGAAEHGGHGGYARRGHSLARRRSPADVVRERFGAALAEVLEEARAGHRFEELALVMAPRLLGLVRQHLSKETRRAVVAELHRSLMGGPVERVERLVRAARPPMLLT